MRSVSELFSRFGMARRIDHTSAKFPNPTARLLEQAAESAYLSFCLRMEFVPMDWDKVDENVRDAYVEIARATFAVFAIAGGARIEQV
tara:strand:+ start:448 stop:711 length:264 start_codon:yes stop_codon:yes gene_type:complete